MSAILHTSKEAIVSVFQKYGWEVGRAAIIPASVLATLYFNTYFILDPPTRLTGVGCAILINTVAISYLHVKIQNYWTNYWKEINEKSKKFKKLEKRLNDTTKEYEDACKKLEKAQQDIKKGSRDLEVTTQGKKVAVDTAKKDSDGLFEAQKKLKAEKEAAILTLERALKTMAHYVFKHEHLDTLRSSDVDVEKTVIASVNADLIKISDAIAAIDASKTRISDENAQLIIEQKKNEVELEVARLTQKRNTEILLAAASKEDALARDIEKDQGELEQARLKKESAIPSDEAYKEAELLYQTTVEKLHFLKQGIHQQPASKTFSLDDFQLETLSYDEVLGLSKKLTELLETERRKKTELVASLQPLLLRLKDAITQELASIETTAKGWVKDLTTRKEKTLLQMKEKAEKRKKVGRDVGIHLIDGVSTLSKDGPDAEQPKVDVYFEKLATICDECIATISGGFTIDKDRDKGIDPVTFPITFQDWGPNLNQNPKERIEKEICSGIQRNCSEEIAKLLQQKSDLQVVSAFYSSYMRPQGGVEESLKELDALIVLDNHTKIGHVLTPYQVLKLKKQELYLYIINIRKIENRMRELEPILTSKDQTIKALEKEKIAKQASRDRLKGEYEALITAYQEISARCNALDRQVREKKEKLEKLKGEHKITQQSVIPDAEKVRALERGKEKIERNLVDNKSETETNETDRPKLANTLKEVEQILKLLVVVKERQGQFQAVEERHRTALRAWVAANSSLEQEAAGLQKTLDGDKGKRTDAKKLFDTALGHLRTAKTDLRIGRIRAARLELYSNIMEKCQRAQALCEKKKRMLEFRQGDLTPAALEVYQRTAAIEEKKMNIVLERAELSRARHFEELLDQSALADFKTDEDRFNLVKCRLERMRVNREQRVLTGSPREEKKQLVLELFEKETKLIYKFYSSKIARGKLGKDGKLDQKFYTKCSIKLLFAILDLQLERMIFEGSPRKGRDPLKGSEIITSLIKFFQTENANECKECHMAKAENANECKECHKVITENSAECKEYHSVIADKIGQVDYFANIGKALEADMKVHDEARAFIEFKNLIGTLSPLLKTKPKLSLVEEKLKLIQQLAVKPVFTDAAFDNTYSKYEDKLKDYRKTKYDIMQKVQEMEEACINEKELVTEDKIDNETNESWRHNHPFLMGWGEKISYLAPAALLFLFYLSGLVPNLSKRASRNTLFIGTISYLFVRTIYPTNAPTNLQAASQ